MTTTQQKQGFTIIEVVLVLAIAGLIFLMVFIALPALQRGQRDTARRSDVSTVSAAYNTFTTNNRGAEPDTTQLVTQLGGTGTAPNLTFDELSNNTTNVVVGADVPAAGVNLTIVDGRVEIRGRAECGTVGAGGAVALTQGTARQYATVTRLEGGNGTGFCLDS